LGFVRFKLSLI
jgi:Methyladenine glycosylase